MTKKPILLIVVDFQYDFCDPQGALYVQGAPQAGRQIIGLLQTGQVKEVIFTADWHIPHHPSFKEQGGVWPRHCVQHSHGAAIDRSLLETCLSCEIPYSVVVKGEREEEYGAFRELPQSLTEAASEHEIYLCGLAGDYCVLETLKNIGQLHPVVFLPGIASIDNGEKLKRYVAEHGIGLFPPDSMSVSGF